MAIRFNNLGNQKRVKWGHMRNYKAYTNEAFAVIEAKKKQKRYDWQSRLKPWDAMDEGTLWVMMPCQQEPTPPPTSQEWQDVTDQWQTIDTEWQDV
jgi:hypothetical protein